MNMAETEEIEKPEPGSLSDFEGKVESHLREAQEHKAFKDSAIRVGGSRKEMAAIRKLSRFGVEELAENEKSLGDIAMIKFVKKDQVFPKFDVKEQLSDGVSSSAAFLKMKLREAFPGEPKIKTPVARKVYVGFANMLYDTFLKTPTVESFNLKRGEVARNIQTDVAKFVLGDKWQEVALEMLHALGPKDVIEKLIVDYQETFANFDFEQAYDYLIVGNFFDDAV